MSDFSFWRNYVPGMFSHKYRPDQMQPPPKPMDALDIGALATAPIPALGDALGLAADARMYATEPESRTWGNYALSALGALPFVPPVAHTVYHGSPHRWAKEAGFPRGRPRLDKMGTGEGAQAYGHGFYAAESPGVAKSYARDAEGAYARLSGHLDPKEEFAYDLMEGGHGTTEILQKMVQKYGGNITFEEASAAIDKARDFKAGEGIFYKLDIPDEAIPNLLDWDAPLSEQPDGVRKAIEAMPEFQRLAAASGELSVADMAELGIKADKPVGYMPTGQELMESLERQYGREGVSSKMREAGIPGLKYYDQMSRGAGDGTRNFVIWDQDLLDQTEILGINNTLFDDMDPSLWR